MGSEPENDAICEICDLRRGFMVARVPEAGIDIRTCRSCHRAGAIPIWLAISHTVTIGGMSKAAPWWDYLIHDTLEHLNVTRTEFDVMVAEEMATTGVR